jgi:hypothetical protein
MQESNEDEWPEKYIMQLYLAVPEFLKSTLLINLRFLVPLFQKR